MKEFSSNHFLLSSAFQHVKENHGCAGVDGVTIERFEKNLDLNLARLQDEVEKQIYFPLPIMMKKRSQLLIRDSSILVSYFLKVWS